MCARCHLSNIYLPASPSNERFTGAPQSDSPDPFENLAAT